MREILFRGRQKGGTEWFYGDLSYLVHDKQKCYIFPADGYNSPDWYEVDPATVGQYTGMIDRNGKRIFEADIVSAGCYMLVTWDEKFGSWCLQRKGWAFKHFFGEAVYPQDCEVVSNVFDNRDLLETTP